MGQEKNQLFQNEHQGSEEVKLRYTIREDYLKENKKVMFKKNILTMIILLFFLFIVLSQLFLNIWTVIIIFSIILVILAVVVGAGIFQNKRNVPSTIELTDTGFTNQTPHNKKLYEWKDFVGYKIKSNNDTINASKIVENDKLPESVKEIAVNNPKNYRAVWGELYYLYTREKQILPSVYLPSLPENSEEVKSFLNKHLVLLK